MERKNILISNCIDENFILRRESDELAAKRKELAEKLTAEVQKTIKKALLRKLPSFAAFLIGATLGLAAFESHEKSIALTVAAVVLIGVGIVLTILNHKREKAEAEKTNENLAQLDALYNALDEEVKDDLGVPTDAAKVGFFTENDDLNKQGQPIYSNYTAFAFVENETLCFWQYGEILGGIPLNEIESLIKVNNPITFDNWESDDAPDSPKYAQYGIAETPKTGEYSMTGYYSLRVVHADEHFEVRFPLFDADALLGLIGREIVEE
jgi:hypothetical protein